MHEDKSMLMLSNWNHKNKSNQMNFIVIVLIAYWPHKTTHKKSYWHTFSELFKHNNSTELWPKCAKFHFIRTPFRIQCIGSTFSSYLGFWFTRTARRNSISYECCNPNCIRFNENSVSECVCCWVVVKLSKLSRFFSLLFSFFSNKLLRFHPQR